MAKGRRLVVLDEEMRDPGGAIARDRNDDQPAPALPQQKQRQRDQHQRAAKKMPGPRRRPGMFAQIERPEFRVAAEAAVAHPIRRLSAVLVPDESRHHSAPTKPSRHSARSRPIDIARRAASRRPDAWPAPRPTARP